MQEEIFFRRAVKAPGPGKLTPKKAIFAHTHKKNPDGNPPGFF